MRWPGVCGVLGRRKDPVSVSDYWVPVFHQGSSQTSSGYLSSPKFNCFPFAVVLSHSHTFFSTSTDFV